MKTDMSPGSTLRIYALFDPREPDPCYIGSRRDSLAGRLRHHISDAKRGQTPVNVWVRSLLGKGIRPCIKLLEEAPADTVELAEARWVARYRALGAPLRNATWNGGPGRRPGVLVRQPAKPFIDDEGTVYLSQRAFSRIHGVHQSTVSLCLSGKLQTVAGYRLRYLDAAKPLNAPTREFLQAVLSREVA